MEKFYLGFGLGTLLFSLHVSYSPQMKGIAFRPNSQNEIIFSPSNIVRLMYQPFTQSFYWIPSNWDLNWPLVAISTGVITYLLPMCLNCN